MRHILVGLCGVMLFPIVASAEDQKPSAAEEKVIIDKGKAAVFDYGVPSSPAERLIGVAADKITPSTSLKPFILSLPNTLSNKEQGQSVSLSFAPASMILSDYNKHHDNYVDNAYVRLLYKTHLSTALYEGEKNTDSAKSKRSRLAFGVSSSLLSSNDPLVVGRKPDKDGQYLTSWERCLGAVFKGIPDVSPERKEEVWNLAARKAGLEHQQIEQKKNLVVISEKISRNDGDIADLRMKEELIKSSLKDIQAKLIDVRLLELDRGEQWEKEQKLDDPNSPVVKGVQACRQRVSEEAALGASLDVGAGMLLHGDPGKLKNLSDGSGVFWFSGRLPIANEMDETGRKVVSSWLIGASGRFAFDEFVATGNAAIPTVKANTWDAWAGLEHMDADTRLAFQVGYQHRKGKQPVPAFDKSSVRYLASYTQRLSDKETGLWVKVSYGYADQQGDDDKRVLLALTYSPPAIFNIFNTAKK